MGDISCRYSYHGDSNIFVSDSSGESSRVTAAFPSCLLVIAFVFYHNCVMLSSSALTNTRNLMYSSGWEGCKRGLANCVCSHDHVQPLPHRPLLPGKGFDPNCVAAFGRNHAYILHMCI